MGSPDDILNLRETNFCSFLSYPNFHPSTSVNKNLLEYGDDVLYAWDPVEQCVSVLLTKTLALDDTEKVVQNLRPTEPIEPDKVNQLLLSHQRNKLAIICAYDIYVLDLPSRTPPYGAYKGGTTDVTCSRKKIRFQPGGSQILRTYWHPSPEFDRHLVILTSDNTIHVNDVSEPVFIISYVIRSGPQNRIPSFHSTGEVAVDFHFITQMSIENYSNSSSFSETSESENQMEWPAVVLHENGDVIIIDIPVHPSKTYDRKSGKVTSPLLMYPSAEDNYGVECNRILVLEGPLPIVVISSNTGVIYHSILLNHPASDYENYELKKDDLMEKKTAKSVYVLHVIESIELDIVGLDLDDQAEELVMPSFPIQLIHDATDPTRYFAIHAAGVHSISLPIIHELKIFFSKNYEAVELPPHTLLDFKKNRSVVEYSVCSQISGGLSYPVIGAVCVDCPTSVLVVVFADKILSIRISSWYISPKNPSMLKESNQPKDVEVKQPLFQDYIQSILRPDNLGMPIFKMSNRSNPTSQQSLELLARATSYFREVIIPRHQQAAQVIRTRVQTLVKVKERQLEDMRRLMEMKDAIKSKAEELAEKYEDGNEKQIQLAKRAGQVLVLVKTKDRGLTKSELAMCKDLEGLQQTADNLLVQIDGLRIKEVAHTHVNQEFNKVAGPNNAFLSNSHFEIIKKSFSYMTGEIENLMTQVEQAETELDFDNSLNNQVTNNDNLSE